MNHYDHARKAGNRGDVWKHFALLSTVDARLREAGGDAPFRDRETPFRYRETHCGAGVFVLDRVGEWRQGIGAVLPVRGRLRSHPYFALVGDALAPDDVYLGSWRLVARLLQDRGARFRMRLTDTSTAVSDQIWFELGRLLLPPAIEFLQLDGFDALAEGAGDDLVLIDPPFRPAQRDWLRCRKAAARLTAAGASYLLWYPVYGPGHPERLIAAAAAPGFELLWAAVERPSRRQKGCGLVAGGRCAAILEAARGELEELAALLGGRLEVRRP